MLVMADAGPGAVVTEITRCPACAKKNRVPSSATGVPRCGSCHNPLPWIVGADDTSFAAVVESSSTPVLVDLWAPWCGPCRMVSPTLEKLAHDFAGRVKLVKVNVDGSPAIAQRFRAQSIPTLLVVKRGQEVARQIGAAPEATLRTWLTRALDDPKS
jgi:thioredoxin 2